MLYGSVVHGTMRIMSFCSVLFYNIMCTSVQDDLLPRTSVKKDASHASGALRAKQVLLCLFRGMIYSNVQ